LKLGLLLVVVVVILVIGVAAIYYAFVQTGGPVLCGSKWECAAGYPIEVGGTYAVAGEQCLNATATVYCIGGQDANSGPQDYVYYATVSSSGNITGWTLSSTAYPQDIYDQSCVASSGYVYCVGGTYDGSSDDVASSYFAQIMPGGTLGSWSSTTAYPIPVDTEWCGAYSSYIYCVGGYNETDGYSQDTAASSSVWYAPLSSSGIGTWTLTTAYPNGDYLPSCYAAGAYLYCIGGADANGNPLGTTYYASLSSSGVGAWTATTPYPVAASGQACVIGSGEILCVGGETSSSPAFTGSVYYAPIIPTGGIGSWKPATSYPVAVGTDCVALSGNVYCVGGLDGSSTGANNYVEYTQIASLTS